MKAKAIKIKRTISGRFEFHIPEAMSGTEFEAWKKNNIQNIKNFSDSDKTEILLNL
jgi:hypothetical protein